MPNNHEESNRCIVYVMETLYSKWPHRGDYDLEQIIRDLYPEKFEEPKFVQRKEYKDLTDLYHASIQWLIENEFVRGVEGRGGHPPKIRFSISISDKGLLALRRMPDSLTASNSAKLKEAATDVVWSISKTKATEFVNKLLEAVIN